MIRPKKSQSLTLMFPIAEVAGAVFPNKRELAEAAALEGGRSGRGRAAKEAEAEAPAHGEVQAMRNRCSYWLLQ